MAALGKPEIETRAWTAHGKCVRFKDGLGDDNDLRTIEFVYQTVLPFLSEEQSASLQDAIADFNIPISIGE